MAIKEHSLLFIHTQTPRKRNNPFHSSVLCTHPGGRFLRDFSRRGQLAKNASNANSPGFISIGISWIFRGLASSASRRAQVSNCLCRMISSSCVCVSCIGDSVLLVMVLPCKAMRRSTSRHGADSNYSDSLALRRWRRLISPFAAVTRNPAVLSPGSLSCSISVITSCGILTVVICDFAFFAPVAISGSPDNRCISVYAKKKIKKVLRCISPECRFKNKGEIHPKQQRPAVMGTHTGRLTKPLIEVTIMAIKEHSLLFIHTQTPRKRNNPFHSSVLCTHPGGRFLPDLSRRGYLSTKSSRANFSGGTKRGAGGGIFVLVSSSSSLAQASDCLCRMISSSCVCVSCIGDSVLLVMILPCKAMRRSTSHHGADSDYSDSLALRRWRYSTSRFNAAVTNCPVLSPGIFTASTLFITSCGTLAATVCDFAFTAFVAMLSTPHKKQMQYAGKKTSVQHLTCLTPRFKLVFNTLFRQGVETTKPRTVGAVTGLLTNNVNEEPLWLL
ncbi:hypothetical protein BvCmsSIP078_02283 [Escherichia coli]|nr:hypothetical protein BvCmsSIP078_02283 [Escherichia coli]